MPRDLVERSEFTAPVPVPEDGDDQTAASVANAFQALANRTRRHEDRILALDPDGTGARALRRVPSLADLRSIPSTDRVDGSFCFVDGLGAFQFQSTSLLPVQEPLVVQPSDLPPGSAGRWVIACYRLLGAANGLATLDASGRLAPGQLPSVDRYTPIDADDVLVWKLDERGIGLFSNSGSAGPTLTTALKGDGAYAGGWDGVFGNSVSFPGTGRDVLLGAGSIGLGITTFSASLWVRLQSYGGNDFGFLLAKRYRNDNSWAPPYVTFAMYLSNQRDGRWQAVLKTTARPNPYLFAPLRPLPLYTWTHLAVTYDGMTIRGYVNGNLLPDSTSAQDAVDNGSTSGAYMVGAVASTSVPASPIQGEIDDIRIAWVTRSADYYRSMYQRAVGMGAS